MPLESPLTPFDRTRRVSCLGIDTFVAEAGQGRPLLFLHGNPDTHDAWSGIVALLKQEFACFAPDLPGYGTSAPQGDLELEKQGEWVRELIAALGLQRPHLVVHDVGGTYGLAFTAMYPELISKLTILNTNFFPDYRWHFWGRVWRTPVLGDLAMLIAFRALFVNEMTKASPKLPRDYAERAFASFGSKTRKMVLRYYRYLDSKRLVGWDVRLLKALETLPHQVLWGDRDTYIPKATADRFSGEAHHFADLGHWAMIEDPQQIASHLAAFARR
jgi:pimeloyl-ACP methyl ester carboxylesterase